MISSNTQISEIAALIGLEGHQIENTRGFAPISTDSLETLYALGYELYKNGKYEDAKSFFRFLTLSDSFEYKYWMSLASCHQMLKSYQEAIECYSIAAIQNPSNPYIHWHAADCYFHSGNLSKAKEALASALTVAGTETKYAALLPKLELIKNTWSNMQKEDGLL